MAPRVAARTDGGIVRRAILRRRLHLFAVAAFIAGPLVFILVGGLTRGGGDVVDEAPAVVACGISWAVGFGSLLASFALEPPFRGEVL